MIKAGAPQEVIDAAAVKIEEFEVFDDNWKAVELFQRLATQWVWSSGGGAIGFNYQSVEFLLRLYGIKQRRQIFEELQIMELAVIKFWNAKEGK